MIAAIHPCSFVDYPGRLAAVLFTQGCNLRCRYCHNPELCKQGEGVVGVDAALRFLESRRGLLSGVVLSGGEPTMRSELGDLLRAIRDLGFAVKLDTNGSRPDVVGRLLNEQLVEFVAVDVKVARGAPSRVLCGAEGQAESALETLGRVVRAGVPHEARTTIVGDAHDEAHLERIAEDIASVGAGSWRLQPVARTRVLDETAELKPPGIETMERAAAFARGLGVDAAVRK